MIYKILPDLRHFKQFSLDEDEIESTLGEDCLIFMDARPTRYLADWKPLQVTFFDEFPGGSNIKQRPDIMVDFLGKLFLDEKATAALSPLLTPAGELLPVSYDSASGCLFNPLVIAEDLDAVDSADVKRDKWNALIAPEFVADKLGGAVLFRTALDSFRGIYCTDTFKAAVEKAGLSGVRFSEDLRDRPPE